MAAWHFDGGPLMPLFRLCGNVNDDAGKKVKLLDPAAMCEWPTRGDERIDALVKRVRRALSASSCAEQAMTVLLAVGIVAAVRVAMLLSLPSLFSLWGAAVYGGIILIGIGLSKAFWRIRLQSNGRRVADALLDEGLCPCCGYNFAGLGIENKPADSLATCPECGSAWRRGRIDRVVPFDPSLPRSTSVLRFSKRENVPTWSTVDDRKARVLLVHPRLSKLLRKARDSDTRDRLRLARARISRSRVWVRYLLAITLWSLGVWCLTHGIANGDSETSIVAVILGGLGIAALRGKLVYSPAVVRRAMLENGFCPTCGADLTDLPLDSGDGWVRCAGCRSTWNRYWPAPGAATTKGTSPPAPPDDPSTPSLKEPS